MNELFEIDNTGHNFNNSLFHIIIIIAVVIITIIKFYVVL